MSRHTSPVRLSKREYADGLEAQINDLQQRRREQPSYVAGKVGSRVGGTSIDFQPTSKPSYSPGASGPGLVQPQPPSDGPSPAAARARQSQAALADALERQIREKEHRARAEKEAERRASRERMAAGGGPENRRQGRAWVQQQAPQQHFSQGDAPENFQPPPAAVRHQQQHFDHHQQPQPQPALPQYDEPEWMRSTDDVSQLPSAGPHPPPPPRQSPSVDGPLPSASSPQHGRRSSAQGGGGRTHSNSPIRGEKSFSGRHVSPERLRESEFELRSERKLFDFDKRESFEEERRRVAARQQEELAAALRAQIEEREAKRAEERRREEALDRLMERRARDEAAAMAAAERAREEAQQRQVEEAEEVNRNIARRHHSVDPAVSPHPPRSASAAPDPGLNRSPGPESPAASGIAARRHSSVSQSPFLVASGLHSSSPGSVPSPGGDVAVSREDLRQVLESLQEIRAELARGPPLPDASPSAMVSNHDDGGSFGRHIDYGRGPVAPTHAPYLATDSATEEAHRILERNRQRLAALRYANKHDDILRAFLLQDSNAAMQTVTDLHSNRRAPAYPAMNSYQSWGGGGASSPQPRGPAATYSASSPTAGRRSQQQQPASPPPQQRSYTSMY